MLEKNQQTTMECVKLCVAALLVLCVFIKGGSCSNDEDLAKLDNYLKRFHDGIDEDIKKIADVNSNKDGDGDVQYIDIFGDVALHDGIKKQDIIMEQGQDAASDDSASAPIRRKRTVSREGSHLRIDLVSIHPNKEEEEKHRVRRATYNTTNLTWPNRIPFVFDSTYPDSLRHKVRRVMRHIESQLCVEWVEFESFDPENNDFNETNAYLLFMGSTSNVCSAFLGQGAGTSVKKLTTCTSWMTMTHEIFHTLGVVHEQQGPLAGVHTSLALQNLQPNVYGGTYKLQNHPDRMETAEYDSTSVMMYSRRAFSANGLDIVLPYREDELTLNSNRRTNLATNLRELNIVYKCKERKCAHIDIDCRLGYVAYINGKCQCACPQGFDSRTNCQLENEQSGPETWPDTPFTMLASDRDTCPEGFNHGSIDISGYRNPSPRYEPFPTTDKAVNFHMCSRNSPVSSSDWEKMPAGTYCVVKPMDVECSEPFVEGYINVTSEANITSSGSVGDWPVGDDLRFVQLKFCCRMDKEYYYTMDVPRQSSFSLISKNGYCPFVNGMRYYKGLILQFYYNSQRNTGNMNPQNWLRSNYIAFGFCKYVPPTYGCNEDVTLDAENPSHTITTPGYIEGQRKANTRCLYNFNVPEGARVKITFIDEFDIDASDIFNVRRFNRWAAPQLDFPKYFKRQFISEKDFMMLEYWSGKSASSARGAKFVAEVLLAEDNCFPAQDRGVSYIGTKNVTEIFEPCLPWAQATACADFPFSGDESLKLMSHNFCRNPNGAMERPWCYVSTDRDMCVKSYCDVCNNLDIADQLPESVCQSLAQEDVDFCKHGLQRLKCSTTCEINVNVPVALAEGGCGAPPVPVDGVLVDIKKHHYSVGESVAIKCKSRGEDQAPILSTCGSDGWPYLKSACSVCPAGWIPYGERCFTFNPSYLFIDEADAYCKSIGGRLFEFTNDADISAIRDFKQNSNVEGAYGSSWVNCKLRVEDNEWCLYDIPDRRAEKLTWIPNAVLNEPETHSCAVMVWERDTEGKAGKFQTTDCMFAASRTFCEMPRKLPSNDDECVDQSSHCAEALRHDPHFCTRGSSFSTASQFCPSSCGVCGDSEQTCVEPTGSNYHRVSNASAVNVGEEMEFECDEGYFHAGGDLKRACSHVGSFYGQEPICNEKGRRTDVGVGGVIKRIDILNTGRAFLYTQESHKIPVNGNVTNWHLYGILAGPVNMFVARFNSSSNNYDVVGYNELIITTVHERWTFSVPPNEQIPAKKGDYYGFYSPQAQIAATNCNNKMYAVSMISYEKIYAMSDLTGGKPFTSQECWLPSIGVTITP